MIRKLEMKEVGKTYRKHVKKDFPPIERPPCYVIKHNIKKGFKEGFIYVDEGKGEELGYAFNSISEEAVLISLFAVFDGNRGNGVGTKFLKELLEYNNKATIVEVEKPEYAKNDEEKKICDKRILFYEKLGFKIYKDIDYTLFGFPYYIMVYSKNDILSEEEIVKQLKIIYSSTLRKRFKNMLDKVLQIKIIKEQQIMEKLEKEIDKTNLSDLSEIMLIYNYARDLMNSHDNFQWDEYYPTEEMIIEDINNGNHFTVKENNKILGVFTLVDYDFEYDDIDGKWLNNNPYVEIKKIALKKLDFLLITYIINYVFEKCPNIKVDTGEDNIGVQKVLERNKFIYCGKLKSPEYRENINWFAYQKIER